MVTQPPPNATAASWGPRKRNSEESRRSSPRWFRFRVSAATLPPLAFVLALLLLGCASPGEPTARTQPVPQAVSDLAASQSGNAVLLTFMLPQVSVSGRPLEQPPTVQIYRDFEPTRGSGHARPTRPKLPTLLVTIPSELVPRYTANDKFRYLLSLEAADFSGHAESAVAYSVRTRVSGKKLSADSNLATVRIYPAPDPIDDLKGVVTPAGVQLSWTPPQKTPVGPVPPLASYQIFRGEGQAKTAAPNSSETSSPASNSSSAALPGIAASPPPRQSPLVKIGESTSPDFRDANAEFRKTYVYSVRSVLDYSGTTVESADSNFLVIALRDTFPPAAPKGLIAIFAPAAGGVPAHVDLSWAVSPEADLAGYRVYRSEEAGVLGTPLDKVLLLTPAFRDMNVVSGRRYYYAVTAVDRSGNESAPSAAASVSVPALTQPNHD